MALVTVIIPMYNKGDLIARAIRSVRHQTFQDFSVIVVDDGSTDNGPSIVDNLDDDRIRLIRQPNAGPGAARNTGIKAAQSEYLAFLDADDEWYPWFLENSIAAATKYNVSAVASMYYRVPDNIDITPLAAKNGIAPGRYELDGTEQPVAAGALIAAFQPFNTVIKKQVVEKYGCFYDNNKCLYGEDQYLFIKIVANEPVAVITPPAARYHVESSQLGTVDVRRPLEPYLADPEEILKGCPEQNKQLIAAVLELRAIRTAFHMLQTGRTKPAAELIKHFPNANRHIKPYRKLMTAFAVGPAYHVHLNIKKSFARIRNALFPQPKNSIPQMPYENENEN